MWIEIESYVIFFCAENHWNLSHRNATDDVTRDLEAFIWIRTRNIYVIIYIGLMFVCVFFFFFLLADFANSSLGDKSLNWAILEGKKTKQSNTF